MEKILFWRSTSTAESFGAAFNDADVEFIEFASWDAFNAAGDIVEIKSSCICYNPECPKRRYRDAEGRIYALCLPEDMGGDIAEQIKHLYDKSKAAALADIEKYLREEGYYTTEANCITFDDAPAWWLKRCAAYIADCFSDN